MCTIFVHQFCLTASVMTMGVQNPLHIMTLADATQVPLDESDVYLIEAEVFINAIKSGNADAIESLYEDSALSYQATQWITAASSENRHEKSNPNA